MTSNKRARYDDVVQNGELTSAAEGFFEALGMIDASLVSCIFPANEMLEKPRPESPTASSICTSTQLAQ